MPDNIEINNGEASFASAREDAWHQLGIVLPDSFTAEEAMQAANLGGWNVRKATLLAADPETAEETVVSTHAATIRDNPVVDGQLDVLGIVGTNYEIIQNEEHAEFLNTLVDESGAHFETAGALGNGSRVFLTMKLPDALQVGGVDPVDQYLAAINSHDGSMAFTMLVTPVRIVCQNTLNFALDTARNTFKVRHTKNAQQSISEARHALDISFKYLAEFEQEAERLINTTVSDREFVAIIDREFGAPDDAPQVTLTRAENRLAEMERLFQQANTQEGIRNTAWAAVNALAEYSDHFSQSRGDDHEYRRNVRALFSPGFKNKALAAFS